MLRLLAFEQLFHMSTKKNANNNRIEMSNTFVRLMSTKFRVETVDSLHQVNVSVLQRNLMVNIFAVNKRISSTIRRTKIEV